MANYRVFFREFRGAFRTTGAVLPSGRALSRALCRKLRETDGPRRILEVGPGTGAVTAQILAAMGPGDHLDLVEVNERFVRCLAGRFATETAFQRMAGQVAVIHAGVEDLSPAGPYDAIVSGLPLNNFSSAEVEQILAALVGHLRPGGTLSFFEYMAVRGTRAIVARGDQRRRLREIGQTLARFFHQHQSERQWIWPNVPPAWVHHVRISAETEAAAG